MPYICVTLTIYSNLWYGFVFAIKSDGYYEEHM